MSDIARTVFAVVGGLIVAAVVIASTHFASSKLYPLPPGLDLKDQAAVREAIARLPAGALAMVLLAWALGSLAGGWIACRIARTRGVGHSLVVGVLLLFAGIGNLLAIPHPVWMWIGAFVAFLGGSYFGGRLARKPAAVS